MRAPLQASRPQTLLGIVQLIRPLNLSLALAGVMVGAYLGNGSAAFASHRIQSVLIAAVSAMAVTAAANAINDAFDVTVDRVNRPDRPIPSGRITTRLATITWLAGALLGIGTSLMLSAAHVLIASAAIVLVYLYSAILKRIGFIGNLVVSVVVAASVIYGALASGQIGKSWAAALLALMITLAREITKDLEDIEGDGSAGVRTLPLTIGRRRTCGLVISLVAATIVAAPLPYLYFAFDRLYLFGIALADFCLLGAIWYLSADSEDKIRYGTASALLKSAMVAGLGALLLA
jgi:geranylgeranylglycerol-phosphate geranylgeranyltransferase